MCESPSSKSIQVKSSQVKFQRHQMHGRQPPWQPFGSRTPYEIVCDYSAARPHCVSSDARERFELGFIRLVGSSNVERETR